MFKKIPGNTQYRINLNCDIVDHNGNAVNLPVFDDGKVEIDFFGSVRKISLKRLAMLAWYEMGHLNDPECLLTKARFKPIDTRITRVRCGYVTVFDEIQPYGNGFVYVPCYARYAVNAAGEVLDTFSNEIVQQNEYEGYRTVQIYSPDKCKFSTIRVHRLMALAWLANDDFLNRAYVNHIDGCKSNNRLSNLEWCSLSENSRHAFDTGLNTGVVKMKTRDVLTGEIRTFNTVQELAKWLGVKSGSASNFTNKLPGYLVNRRYEIKTLTDDSPWYYEKETIADAIHGPLKSIFTIDVIDKSTGEFSRFGNLRAFIKHYRLRLPSDNISLAVQACKDKNPGIDIRYKRNAVAGPYRVIDTTNGQVLVAGSMVDVSDVTGIPRPVLQFDLSRNRKYIYAKRWVVIPADGDMDYSEYVHKPIFNGRAIDVTAPNGKVSRVDAIRAAAKLSGLDAKTVTKFIRSGGGIKGWNFRAVDP